MAVTIEGLNTDRGLSTYGAGTDFWQPWEVVLKICIALNSRAKSFHKLFGAVTSGKVRHGSPIEVAKPRKARTTPCSRKKQSPPYDHALGNLSLSYSDSLM